MRRKKSGGFLNSNLQANIMRCPKCGYISFDQMEICGGCKKNVAKFSSELSGVVFKAEAPDFLWFVKPQEEESEEEAAADEEAAEEPAADTEEDGAEDDQENTVEFSSDDDGGLDLGEAAGDEAKEIEFDLGGADDEPAAEEEAKEEIAFDLPGAEENAAPSLELDSGGGDEGPGLQLDNSAGAAGPGLDLSVDGLDGLDFDLESADEPKPKAEKEKAGGKKKAAKDSGLDLSGIDLSGLMPPAPEKEKLDLSFSGIGELSLEDGPAADIGPTAGKGKAGGKKKSGAGGAADTLPDLSIDGLDLNAATLPPAKSAAGKKLRPAAKTGTALDEFNIDLGDLLGGGGKKK